MNKQIYNDIQETVYTKTLPNGLIVYLIPKQERSKTYGLFATNYGSMDQTFVPIGEEEEITVPDGIAHFLEHKLFEKEDRDVFADFGKQGASPNAYTSFTKTAYLFSATTNIEQNVETLLDFVQDPYFSETSVENEKGIIAQEIKMYDDQPDWQSFIGTVQGMFKHHPVKIDIAGTVESIHKITKEDLYTCYYTFYHPENMTLFLTGNFDGREMMELIEKNQSSKDFEKTDPIKRSFPPEPEEVAMKEKTLFMPVSVPNCTVGIKESTTVLDRDTFLKKDLLQGMVMSYYFSKGGQFYQELYTEGLIDSSFNFSSNLEKNFGYTLINTNTSNPDQYANKVKELLLSTNEATFTSEEFETMKRKRIGQLLRVMNSLEYIASQYTHYYLQDIDFFKLIPAIQSLTMDDLNEFVKNWIKEERLAVCKIVAE